MTELGKIILKDFEKAEQKGEQKGEEKKTLELIVKNIKKGKSNEEIHDFIEVSLEEIEKIRQNISKNN